jgi:site-specific recombinase XerD
MNQIRPPVKVDQQGRVIRDPRIRAHRWLQNVPASFTGHKKERKFFHSESDAKKYRESLIEALKDAGTDLRQRLKARGMSVTDAIEYALKHAPTKAEPTPLKDACTAYLQTRKELNGSSSYQANLESQFKELQEELGNPMIDTISYDELTVFVKGMTGKDGDTPARPKTKINMIITLNALFNYAVEEGWRGVNPATKLRRPKMDEVDTAILTPGEVQQLLEEGKKPEYADVFPAVVIQIFAGPRRSELPHMQWENIRDNYLRLDKTKIKKKRAVAISDTLLEWLAPFRNRTGRIFAPIDVAFDPKDTRNIQDAYTYRVSQLAAAATVILPKNVLRHTAITYRDAMTGDLEGTAAWGGNSPGVIQVHYRGAATKDEAAAFYGIRPSSS